MSKSSPSSHAITTRPARLTCTYHLSQWGCQYTPALDSLSRNINIYNNIIRLQWRRGCSMFYIVEKRREVHEMTKALLLHILFFLFVSADLLSCDWLKIELLNSIHSIKPTFCKSHEKDSIIIFKLLQYTACFIPGGSTVTVCLQKA